MRLPVPEGLSEGSVLFGELAFFTASEVTKTTTSAESVAITRYLRNSTWIQGLKRLTYPRVTDIKTAGFALAIGI
jgi:hypothetical protein